MLKSHLNKDALEVLENNAQTILFPPQIADPNNRRNTKNNQHHGRKSPFERKSNANRNTFYKPLIRKPVGKRPFPHNMAKTMRILIIHPGIY